MTFGYLQLQHTVIKIEIGLVKGKKIHDKRESIKEKDIKRQLEKNI